MGKEMSEEVKENGIIIFAITVMISLLSAAFYVFAEEQKAVYAEEIKCEDAGWTWLSTEEKCLMTKVVK